MLKPDLLCIGCLIHFAVAGPILAADSNEQPEDRGTQVEFTTEQLAFFEKKIRPILVKHCYECHSDKATTIQGGLRLDNLQSVRSGGDLGPAINLSDPQSSLLLQAVQQTGDVEMPPDGKLTQSALDLLETWVMQGAPMPAGEIAPRTGQIDWEEARQFWSFRPLSSSDPPVENARLAGRIDSFIAARLKQNGLQPAAPASRRMLIRRLYFDVLGVPPTVDQVFQFQSNTRPGAWQRLVERVLASPRFGERWGRFWLDNARYTDTTSRWLEIEGSPYVYRDWIVRALNEDLAYDQFIRLQLAADAIERKRPADNAALGFLGLSPTYWKELRLDPVVIEEVVASEWEERIDTIGRTFLGLTIACARCHDHKFDPITSRDYYALAGVMANTRMADAPIIPENQARPALAARREVAELEQNIAALRKREPAPDDLTDQLQTLKSKIARARQVPFFQTPVASAVTDAAIHVKPDGSDRTQVVYEEELREVRLQIRGNPATKGEVVPRQFLRVFREEDQPFRRGSGRLDLAEAIVTDARALCARVLANRLWHYHFGAGLVDTPSNFGVQGSRPTHPLLLDDLAKRFVERGWSSKWLHREMLTSAAYRQSSGDSNLNRETDPENRWIWRMNRRQLDFEAWRDAMLTVSGELDSRMGGSPAPLSNTGNRRRTIYGLVNRRDVATMLQLYDFPDPTAHSPQRRPTITPLQQLFVLNSPFLQARSAALAKRVLRVAPPENNERSRIKLAYQLVYQRSPDPTEIDALASLLNRFSHLDPRESWRRCAQVLLASNEFLFVD